MACWIRGLLNGCLLLVLLLQGCLLFTLWHWGYWSVPSRLISPLVQSLSALEGRKVVVSYDFLRIYPKKGIHASQVQIYMDECPCPLLRIADARLNVVRAAANGPTRYLATLSGGTLFAPDPFLPEQANLRLIEDLIIRVEITEDKVILQDLKGSIAQLGFYTEQPLVISASQWENLLGEEDATAEDQTSYPEDRILAKLDVLKAIQKVCQQLEGASIAVSFGFDPDAGIRMALQAFASSWRHPEETVSAHQLVMDGSVTWNPSGKSKVAASLGVSKLSHQSHAEFRHIEATFEFPDFLLEDPLPASATLLANRSSVEGVHLDFLMLKASRSQSKEITIEGWTSIVDQALAIHVAANLDAQLLDLSLAGDGDLLGIAGAVGRANAPGIRLLGFDAAPLFSAGARLKQWTRPESAWFEVIGKGVSFKGAHFQYARTRGNYRGNVLTLEEFAATNPDYMIRGSLVDNFDSGDYRYQVLGSGFPADLNPVFLPWWTEMWEQFEFGDIPVAVNLDIWGRSEDSRRRFVFGSVSLEQTGFRGFQLERGRVRLHSIPKCFRLYDMHLEHANGLVTGAVTTVYHAKEDEWITRHLHLDTVLPLDDLLPFTGDALIEIAANTRTEQAPIAEIRGVLVNEDFPEYSHLDVLHVAVDAPGPIHFYEFLIEDFRSEITINSRAVSLDPLRFRFANGEGSGTVRLDRKQEPPLLHFDLGIQGMDYRLAANCIPQKSDQEQPSAPGVSTDPTLESPDDPSNVPTSTTLAMKGSFPVGNWHGLQGVGSFTLEDPLIHRVHLLGGLSKVLSSVDLNLGSFALKEASSGLRLEGPVVFFDDLVLTGPSSRVVARGSFGLEDSSLDFRLKAYPLREVRFPVIAGLALMLRPVTQLFAVRLTGTFDDPEWQIVIDARNI